MPAASDPLPPLPHTWRPFGPRIAGVVFSVLLVATFAFLWWNFDAETRAMFNVVQRVTVVVVVGIGVALMYALARSKVVATETGLVLVNGYRRRDYEWAEVVAIHLPLGAPWPTLDLADGTTVSALGIHGSDGERAKRAVRELKGLLVAQGPG